MATPTRPRLSLHRWQICLAFATGYFADTWVAYAEGNVAYFVRQDPVRAVVVPVIGLEVILALGLFAGWAS